MTAAPSPLVVHLVDALACIATTERPISEIRFYGTQKSLAAYCTDGHMLARVVVKADYSAFGRQALSASHACEHHRWRKTNRNAIAVALGFSVQPPPLLFEVVAESPTRTSLDRMLLAGVERPVLGFWAGEPMRKAFEVVENLRAAVQFWGNETEEGPIVLRQRDLHIDVSPASFFADLDIAVMPRRRG